MMAKIEWNVTVFPSSEIYGVCSLCRAEVARIIYNGYYDHGIKLSKLKKHFPECPKCRNPIESKKTGAPKWEKQLNGDWLVKTAEGDFLIWKYGNAYKWRWRKYGEQYANFIGFASTLADAKRACERHEKWKVF